MKLLNWLGFFENYKSCVFLIFLAFSLTPLEGNTQALAADSEEIQWSAPVYKQLIEEVVYTIGVRRPVEEKIYKLRTDLKELGSHQACEAESPEKVLRNWLNRMSSLSYQLALQCWDADAKSRLQKMDKEEGKLPSKWIEEWKQIFSSNKAILTARIDFGAFVLIEYRIVKGPRDEVVTYETVTLRKSGETWLLTFAAVETPVAANWNAKSNRVQRVFNSGRSTK